MKKLGIVLLWLLGLALVWPVFKPLISPEERPEAQLGGLAVQEGGRIKPLDSVARTYLLLFHGKQSLKASSGERVEAMDWLTDVLFNRARAEDLPVFRIDHPTVTGLFGVEGGTKKYFSYNELRPYLSRIQQQARSVSAEAQLRTPYERAIQQLFGNLIQYQLLTQTVYPLAVSTDVSAFYQRVNLSGAAPSTSHGRHLLDRQLSDMADSPLHLLPHGGQWYSPGQLLELSVEAGELLAPLGTLARVADARSSGDPGAFEAAVGELLATTPELEDAHPGVEAYFNASQPFIVSASLYVLVMLLVFLGWQFSPQAFLPTAYGILCLGFAVHTFGLVLRVIITGYAPVTNLYSSAVSVGWIAALLSLGLEPFQKKGVGSLAAATVGFLTLVVAHHLSGGGDTMEKMRAVLNSNFWLSTHVITIIMGYGATFLAGFLGLIYVLYGWLRKGISPEMQQSFHRMIFGATCFSLLFSFVGTVLGGIWADQSWGRFWGWDPKENGALMIVLWTALMLHALRCRLIKTRGLVNLAIGGNIITAWSWFGTNMLGVGLHSYGFMDSAFFWLVLFWLSQFAFIALEGLFPVRLKKSA
jgi:ABC-type transport system involved in cytochrome c biogenesis permease subunit